MAVGSLLPQVFQKLQLSLGNAQEYAAPVDPPQVSSSWPSACVNPLQLRKTTTSTLLHTSLMSCASKTQEKGEICLAMSPTSGENSCSNPGLGELEITVVASCCGPNQVCLDPSCSAVSVPFLGEEDKEGEGGPEPIPPNLPEKGKNVVNQNLGIFPEGFLEENALIPAVGNAQENVEENSTGKDIFLGAKLPHQNRSYALDAISVGDPLGRLSRYSPHPGAVPLGLVGGPEHPVQGMGRWGGWVVAPPWVYFWFGDFYGGPRGGPPRCPQ